MRISFPLTLFMSCWFMATDVTAQDTLSNQRLVFIPLTVITLGDGAADTLEDPLSLSDSLIYKVSFDLVSVENIAAIHVKLGTSAGGSQILLAEFVPDEPPGGDLGWFRSGSHTMLSLGSHPYHDPVYAEIQLEYTNESMSEAWLLHTED